LLQRGAARVYAIDVGYGQLHDKLRRDARVIAMERVNARYLTPESLPEPVDWIVIDASFIGLGKLLPAAISLLRERGRIIALIKPQFEVGREAVGKGGVVRDAAARSGAIASVIEAVTALGLTVEAQADAVISGPEGNLEHFVSLRASPAA
jgi:23S rRNA (cytidine1920-2'-O)/16S rRNA (cytidine1409-2'-O)-methyltransferase